MNLRVFSEEFCMEQRNSAYRSIIDLARVYNISDESDGEVELIRFLYIRCRERLCRILSHKDKFFIDFFKTTYPRLDDIQELTEEKLKIINTSKLPTNLAPHVNWLIPLALTVNITGLPVIEVV